MFGRDVLLAPEDDMIPERPGPRLQRAGGSFSVAICMDSDAAEVVTKPRLHQGTNIVVQWLAPRLEHVVDNGLWMSGTTGALAQRVGA